MILNTIIIYRQVEKIKKAKRILMNFFHYLSIIMPYFLVLIFGVIFILFLFKIIENKREKIWNKN